MIIRLSACLFALSYVGLSAEESTPTVPVPAVSTAEQSAAAPTAHVPTAPAPTSRMTNSDAPKEPTTDKTSANIVPTAKPLRVAKVEAQPLPFQMGVMVDGGYDSNVLLLPDSSTGTGATRDGSPAFGFEGRLDWKLWQSPRGASVKIGGVGRIDSYSDSTIDSNSHYGGNLVASWVNANRTLIPALAASVNGYQVDGDSVANDGFIRLSLASRGDKRVDIISADYHRIEYALRSLDERSGFLTAGNYRHWFLLEKENPHRRVEVGVRAGRFYANENWQTYNTVRPDVSATWRFGSSGIAKSTRLSATSGLEWRSYLEQDPSQTTKEKQTIWDSQITCAYGLTEKCTLGPFASYTRRLDTIDDRNFNRWTLGLRLTLTLP